MTLTTIRNLFRFHLFSLSADNLTRIKLLIIFVWSPIRQKLGIFPDTQFKLSFQKFGTQFVLTVRDNIDTVAIEDIFINETYKVSLNQNNPVILDLGSHIGTSVIYFKLLYPKSKIFCFEPNPDNYLILKRNIASFDGVKAYNFALSDVNQTNKLYISDGSMSSSLFQRYPKQMSIDVQCRSLDSIVKELGIRKIDLVKFDIEGEEYKVFRSFKNKHGTDYLIGEVHPDLMKASLRRFLSLFPGYKQKIVPLNGVRSLVRLTC